MPFILSVVRTSCCTRCIQVLVVQSDLFDPHPSVTILLRATIIKAIR